MKVNGTIITIDNNIPLINFLKEQDIRIDTIAIELNGNIIPKDTFSSIILKDEDTMEIVRFVGGG